MARLHNMPCRIHPCLSCILIVKEFEIVSVTRKVEKTMKFAISGKTYGELSTTCHHFEYRPLYIARCSKSSNFLIPMPDFVQFLSTGCSQ